MDPLPSFLTGSKTEIREITPPALYLVPEAPAVEDHSELEAGDPIVDRLTQLDPESLLPVLKSILRNGDPMTRELIADHAHRFNVVDKAAAIGVFKRLFNDSHGDVRSAIATTAETHMKKFGSDLRDDLAQMLADLTYEGSL